MSNLSVKMAHGMAITDKSQRMVMAKRPFQAFDNWLASRENELWTRADSEHVREYIQRGDELAQEVFDDILLRVNALLR